MELIAIQLTLKNEEYFLEEWIQYYISLGFINFIFYNDNSKDESETIIMKYKNLINIHYYKIDVASYIDMYKCLNNKSCSDILNQSEFNNIYKFIIYIDIDEFLYIDNSFNFCEFLKNNYKKNNSVILIPRFDVGNPENYYKNINKLECLKYDKISSRVSDLTKCKCYFPSITNIQNNLFVYCCKHISSPKNSIYYNAHKAIPINNTNIVGEHTIYRDPSIREQDYNILFGCKYNNINDFNIRLYHFHTRDNKLFTDKFSKYNKDLCNPNIFNNKHIQAQLVDFDEYHNIHINFFKKHFLTKKKIFIIGNNNTFKNKLLNLFDNYNKHFNYVNIDNIDNIDNIINDISNILTPIDNHTFYFNINNVDINTLEIKYPNSYFIYGYDNNDTNTDYMNNIVDYFNNKLKKITLFNSDIHNFEDFVKELPFEIRIS